MNIFSDETYHIYNQGNKKEVIFLNEENYIHFLILYRKFVAPYCKTLSYCLMPNHFHFLIHATSESEKSVLIGNINLCELSNGFRLLQSKYATYFNRQWKRSGSLFRQRTKAKALSDGDKHYGYIAFHYIHQNPLIAGLVSKMEQWPYSSFIDFMKLRNGTLWLRIKLLGSIIGIFKRSHIGN